MAVTITNCYSRAMPLTFWIVRFFAQFIVLYLLSRLVSARSCRRGPAGLFMRAGRRGAWPRVEPRQSVCLWRSTDSPAKLFQFRCSNRSRGTAEHRTCCQRGTLQHLFCPVLIWQLSNKNLACKGGADFAEAKCLSASLIIYFCQCYSRMNVTSKGRSAGRNEAFSLTARLSNWIKICLYKW